MKNIIEESIIYYGIIHYVNRNNKCKYIYNFLH